MRFTSHLILLFALLALASFTAAAPAQLDARGQQSDSKHPSHPQPHHPGHPPPPPPPRHGKGHPQPPHDHPHPAPPPPAQPGHPHPNPHPQPPYPHPHPGPPGPPPPPPPTSTPHTSTTPVPTTSPTSLSSTTTTASTTSSSTSQPLPSTGVLSFIDESTGHQSDLYLGESDVDDDAAQLSTVGAPDALFGLDSNGHLYSPSNRLLYTDGSTVHLYAQDSSLPVTAVLLSCSRNAASTRAQVLVDCSAYTGHKYGQVDTFVVCDTEDVEASATACNDGSAAISFKQFTLTQGPAEGTLSYQGAPSTALFIGEVAESDGGGSNAYDLEVIELGQSWTLSASGNLVSGSSARTLYRMGSSVATFEPSSAPPDAIVYQCTQAAQVGGGNGKNTIVDCDATLSVCSNNVIYADPSACTKLGGTVTSSFQQFELRGAVQK